MAANSSDTMDGMCESADLRRAECWANAVLERYWDGEYPVDPNAIAVSMGMDVYFARIPGRLAGLILKTADQSMPSIFVDEGASTPRKRFTIAHEIGHYIEKIESLDKPIRGPFGFSDEAMTSDLLILAGRRPTPSGLPDQHQSELFADRFAHSLLMPRAEVEEFAGLGMPVELVAHAFGVSEVTMQNRLHELNVIL
ncbi:ImmA/IrrE family metallo-endopeptidase [Actinomyces bowdenii]|uniref:ImmA/IrrE family metallo-endopeptidase n=1 Tax=Actinomyces bowdenii TaxID=131109 RepID=UPI001ABC0F44|nr:ImmA/IrrE family metallo-endopeptidase [Actinomyces bowdenii]MBO3724200.1 ImmA/IrrE family metallo-endopeptidase [Actinomyces bowdenii]